VCVCSVFVLVTFVSHAKTPEPIEMLFGGLTRVGSRNVRWVNRQYRTNQFASVRVGKSAMGDAAFCQITLNTCFITFFRLLCL